MTSKHQRLDVEAHNLADVDTVRVPRLLVEEMSQAIEAMQTLAAEGMVAVAKGLGLVARKQRKFPPPPCNDCLVDVAVGLPHGDDCASEEATRYRQAELPKLEL